ncbi:GntR family transcriptional regulator [Hoeflea ulvae]|uniref:GntR family transcriptional regulator n=1 Tax=Hoeflea ulvae TaxID=2983764 RepID=A0ABT3YGW1_9HYPH|nr:GntR family transcriptional regulator [Hoeflea ulvae]MCY0095131.1 GntR family transcriptional regulator [Hoeflea ulvae]
MSMQPDMDDMVYAQLRAGLISGRWVSGEKLKPQHLKEPLGCTTAAVREALLRLSGEGFVTAVKHQGFSVVEHNEQTFREAAHLRLILECEAAELAVSRGDFDWEMRLNSAYHQLRYLEQQMAGSDDLTPFLERWSQQDSDFHRILLEACGSSLLMQNYRTVYDTFRMYAVSQIGRFGFDSETNLEEHAAIYNAAISRDAPALVAALKAHLTLYADGNRNAEPIQSSKIERLARFRQDSVDD